MDFAHWGLKITGRLSALTWVHCYFTQAFRTHTNVMGIWGKQNIFLDLRSFWKLLFGKKIAVCVLWAAGWKMNACWNGNITSFPKLPKLSNYSSNFLQKFEFKYAWRFCPVFWGVQKTRGGCFCLPTPLNLIIIFFRKSHFLNGMNVEKTLV